jgi:hypothetical protein
MIRNIVKHAKGKSKQGRSKQRGKACGGKAYKEEKGAAMRALQHIMKYYN